MKTRQHHQPISRVVGPIIFLMALISRLGPIGRYVTPDELAWVRRSANMRAALLSADWANTIQTGHPGIVTTWLGAIGIQLTLWLNPSSADSLEFIRNLAWINPNFGEAYQQLAQFLTGGRFMVALATSAGIWLLYVIISKRFHPVLALLAICSLALDPWIAGLSGLLHVDALLTTFILIALLLVFSHNQLPPSHLVLAGACSAAAALNKIPGGIMIGIIPLILLARQIVRVPSIPPAIISRRFIKELGWWFLGLVVTVSILLPAMWAAPSHVFDILISDAIRISGDRAPIFFMGSADFDIGWHFYPLAILIRQSPLITLGLAYVAWQLAQKNISRKHLLLGTSLAVFCILFWIGISVSSREFIRYALPISAILTLVGGLGLGKALASRKSGLTTIVIGAQICWMAWFWQFPLSTANLVTGGPWASVNQVSLGWGDGVSQAAQAAALRADTSTQRLFTTNVPASAPFYPGEVYLLDDQTVNLIRHNDLIILPLGERQASPGRWLPSPKVDLAPLADRIPSDHPPIHTVRFNQLERAWLYTDLPDPLLPQAAVVKKQQPVRIGDQLSLIESKIFVPTNSHHLVVQTRWQSAPQLDYRIKIHVEDTSGNRWITREEPLISNSGLPASKWSADKSEDLFLKLPFPADMPPADYLVKAEIFDGAGKRLGQFSPDGNFLGTSADFGTITSAAPLPQPLVNTENSTNVAPPFAGFTQPPSSVGQGEKLYFDIWLQSDVNDHNGLSLSLNIGEESLVAPIETKGWIPGQVYRIKGSWVVPVDLPAGDWPLSIQASTGFSAQQLGTVTIEERQRNFVLPTGLQPLGVQFGSIGLLQQANASVTAGQVQLDLIWQAKEAQPSNLIMFVHLKDAAGQIVGQLDRPPDKPTSLWLDGEVISDTIRLDRVDGIEEIAIGLYDPNTGQRVPVFTTDGLPLPDQQMTVNITP